MGSYRLNWPGLTSLPVFFIDTGSKQIYSSNFPLSTEQKHLHHLKNQYVKLSVVLKLLPPALKDDAISQLLKLSSSPGVQGMFVKSEPHKTNDQHRVCYVPVTTLLAFVILYPWSTELQTLRNSIFEFLGGYQEWPCAECGFVKRDCLCDSEQADSAVNHAEFVGYASDVHDAECQTELASSSDRLNTQDTAIHETASSGGMNVAFRIPPGVHLPTGAKIPLALQGWPHIPNQASISMQYSHSMLPYSASPSVPWPPHMFLNSGDPVSDVLSSLTPGHDGAEKGRGKARAQHKDSHTQTPQNLYDSKKRMLKRDSARLKAPSAALIEELEGERLAKEKGTSDGTSSGTSPNKVVEGRGKKKASFGGDDDMDEHHQSPPIKKSKANKRAASLTLLDIADADIEAAIEEESVNVENLPPAFRSFIQQPDVGNLPKPRVPRESVWKFVRRTTDPDDDFSVAAAAAAAAASQPEETGVNIPNDVSEADAEAVKTAENDDAEKLNEVTSAVGNTFTTNASSVTDVDMETYESSGNAVDVHGESATKPAVEAPKPGIDYVGCFEYVPTGDVIVRCTFPGCEQCFDSKLAADFHNSLHQNESETMCYQCPQCTHKVPFGRWFEMLRHLRQAHDTLMVAEDVGCWLCGIEFDSVDVAKKHEEYHYNSRYKCIHCGVLYLTWKQLQAHLFDCANRAKKEVNVGCPYCMFVFHIRNMRRIHVACHCDEGLRCPQCSSGNVWDNWRALRKHYLQKHGRAQNTMDRERRAPPPSYRCQVCSIEVDSTELYYKHMRKTHDWTPYVLLGCTQCEKTFTSKKAADWHERFAHSEEFSCSKCDFKAASKVMIKLHMQKHDERQLTCSECDKTFVHYHQLQIHMAKHARNAVHTCKICYQEFVQYRDLRQHMAKEHPGVKERPSEDEQFGCESCTSRFPSLVALKQHVRREHRDELEDDEDDENRFSEHSASVSKPETSPPTTMLPKRGRGSRGGKGRGSVRGRGRGLRSSRRGYRRPSTWRKTYESMRNFGQDDEEEEEEEADADGEEENNNHFNDDESDADFKPVRGRGGRGRRVVRRPMLPMRRAPLPAFINSPYMTGEDSENQDDEESELVGGTSEGKPDEHLPLHLIDHNYFSTKLETPSALRQKAVGRPSHLDSFITAGHVPDVSEFEEFGNAMNGGEDMEPGVFVPPSCRTSVPRVSQLGAMMKRGSMMMPAARVMHFGGGRGVLTRGGRRGVRGPRMSGFLASRGGGSLVAYPASSPRRGEHRNSHSNNFQWSGMADILTAANHAEDELTESDLASVAAELQKDQSMCMLQDFVMSAMGDTDTSQRDDSDDLSLSPVKQLLQSVSVQAPLLSISPGRPRVIPTVPRTTLGLNGKGSIAGLAQTEVDDIELKDDDYMLWHEGHEDSSAADAAAQKEDIQQQEQVDDSGNHPQGDDVLPIVGAAAQQAAD